ncbi:serine/threonine protein kinase [candidate division WOR-3 bacterium]|uniref:non-specific serine/threonine protein kinase n=1 Tax=candidate division WOR-3 bacterium TaxID=2052148 RepID=A0A660SJ10_UNCW3|nr:MAG: serine/threonine protein kinase [candidate division WOR-3 bacterium]
MRYKTRIGAYKILEELGRGGMAKVYTALQPSLNRIVVVKEMIQKGKDLRLRFKNEARLLASLNHENIIHIYDYVSEGGKHYLVMEHVEGMSLEEVLKFGPLPAKTAALIARGILSGLIHAHRKRIIHRDIKPSNVMISIDGKVKLTDFGIAKGTTSPDLTSTGIIVGTPFYLAPEVAFGERATVRSDIYSVGIVLYEMVTGKRPFGGSTTRALLESIGKGKFPSPYWHAHDRSLRLARIIEKAMSRNEKRRYQSAEEMRRAIDRYLGPNQVLKQDEVVGQLIRCLMRSGDKTTVKIGRLRRKRKIQWWFLIPILVGLLILLYFSGILKPSGF